MRNAKVWLLIAVIAFTLVGTMAIVATNPTVDAAQGKVRDHWRFHDGHWGYWYEPDQAWYYTDGTNWFYNNNDAWRIYNFDRGFGKEGFERGTYRVPEAGGAIVVPRHGVFKK
jgi:hypothetical protein